MRRSGTRDLSTLKKEVGTLLYAFHVGRSRSVTSRQLAERLKFRGTTQVRAAIAELRQSGHPIASSNRQPEGYYIPDSLAEAQECLAHLKSRVRKICLAAAGVEKGLRARFGNQLCLIIDDPVREPQLPRYNERVKDWYRQVYKSTV